MYLYMHSVPEFTNTIKDFHYRSVGYGAKNPHAEQTFWYKSNALSPARLE